MNLEQEKAVEELKLRIKNDLTPGMREDATIFHRFLKARDFDVDKAEKMLLKNVLWRKIQQADTILQNFKPNEFFLKYAQPSFIGYDKDGDMVMYSPTGTFSIYEVYKSVKMNNFIKHFIWFVEKNVVLLEEHNKKTGNSRYQASMIINLEKLSLKSTTSKLTLNLFLRFLCIYQDNYPERAKFVYVINAPSYFVYLYSVLKTMMASCTIKKIHVFGCEGWKEHLLEFIDADVLPAFLGGNRTDPDGNHFCTSFITSGGKIPQRYFLTDKDRYFQSNTQVKKITLSKQEKKEINVEIKESGLLIKWEFLVQNKDIGFGLFFQNSENEIETVIPVQRYGTPDGTEKDSYKCQSPGTYIVIFDNSYSWLSSKTVEYSISVEKPIA